MANRNYEEFDPKNVGETMRLWDQYANTHLLTALGVVYSRKDPTEIFTYNPRGGLYNAFIRMRYQRHRTPEQAYLNSLYERLQHSFWLGPAVGLHMTIEPTDIPASNSGEPLAFVAGSVEATITREVTAWHVIDLCDAKRASSSKMDAIELAALEVHTGMFEIDLGQPR